MRVAFFGGTFDPPHCGHLAIAHAAAARLALDLVLFAPVATQPLKLRGPAPAGFADRLEMVRLAIAGEARFQISIIDAPRHDGQPNYTLNTLARLRNSLQPDDHLFCLLGADAFLTLPKWYRASELLFASDFIVAGRPGFQLEHFALPPGIRMAPDSEAVPERDYPGTSCRTDPEKGPGRNFHQGLKGRLERCQPFTLTDEAGNRSRLYLLPDLREDVSATEIRAALAKSEDHQPGNPGSPGVLPSAVVSYIHAHGLYPSRSTIRTDE